MKLFNALLFIFLLSSCSHRTIQTLTLDEISRVFETVDVVYFNDEFHAFIGKDEFVILNNGKGNGIVYQKVIDPDFGKSWTFTDKTKEFQAKLNQR